jgi:hypothetical protein
MNRPFRVFFLFAMFGGLVAVAQNIVDETPPPSQREKLFLISPDAIEKRFARIELVQLITSGWILVFSVFTMGYCFYLLCGSLCRKREQEIKED